MLGKTLEIPLDYKEIKAVNLTGSQPIGIGILIGNTDAKTEAPVLWPPDDKS